MLWRRSVPAQTLSAPGPVPDTNAIRQMLLQASWQRDRWVVRRRVAMRWAMWILSRYVMPAVLVLAAVAFVWLWLLPRWMPARSTQTAQPTQPAPQATPAAPLPVPATAAVPAITSPPPVSTAPASEPVATTRHTPLVAVPEPPDERPGEPGEPPVQLRLHSDLPALRTGGKPAASAPASKAAAPVADNKFPTPKLTPDNWLHSKEP